MEVCKKQIILPRTDLKKIFIVTDFEKGLDKYPLPEPDRNFILYKNRTKYKNIKKIARGGNGLIFLVDWDNDSIIFKYPITEPDYEPYRVQEVLKDYHHHIIPYKIIYDQYRNPFIIMQQANGDIYDLLKQKLTNDFKNKIISFYARAIGQLWRKRIVFTDMKPENLLYQCSKEDEGITFYFGDIGAFAREGDEDYDYEVEPPDFSGKIDKNFCLFTLGLLVIGIYRFNYKRPKNHDQKSFLNDFYYPLEKQIKKYITNKDIRDITLKLISPRSENLTVNQAVEKLT